MIETLKQIDLHLESQRPYGYSFHSVVAYEADWGQNIDASSELHDTHAWHYIDIGENNPHRARILWEIARHIEGNFGGPYEAILICRDNGTINIHTPTGGRWWNAERWSELSSYIIGLRSLLNILK